jgi:glycosyltransferase involved in cell wall biosynthesis
MPAYNEEANIVRSVRQADRAGLASGLEYEIVVVDDGSTDATADLAEMASDRVRVVRQLENQGYGAALRACLREAKMDLILFVDADNQFDLTETRLLLDALDGADAVLGYRSTRRDPFRRRFVAGCWNRLVRTLFDVPVRDVNCGFKLFRREALEGIELSADGAMISTELVAKLARGGRRIVEVEVTHLPRIGGTPTGMRPRVVARAFVELARMRRGLSAPARAWSNPPRSS